ncbi:MAG: 50S ribosomal protein L18 [Candidatus Bathyarchaeota archaeon]|nr:50S ribosomal protein L18 [Candidatus Bathyarchaeota archaeon]
MAKGAFYNVPYRRRREGKTNYKLRKRLILSGLPRLATRKTRRHIIVQLIKPTIDGDEVIASAHSTELKSKYGWLGSLSNLPASYLTGLLCGYKAAAKGVNKAVLDIGLQTPSRGARIFAMLKGFLDAGGEVPHNEGILPDETRITGQHIGDYASKLSSDPETYSRIFSAYLNHGLTPEKITDHFSSVKEKITSDLRKTAEKE